MTLYFGVLSVNTYYTDPDAGVFSNQINRRGRLNGAVCARSGNFFPGERLRIDGLGRTVGDMFKTKGGLEPYYGEEAIWP